MSVEPKSTSSNRFFYISLLNLISALAVVLLHANGAFWHYRNSHTWTVNCLIECLGYFAVPIFFMLSGITLIDYQDRYSTKTFLRKRFTKTVIPYIFWNLFALFFWNVLQDKNYSTNPLDVYNGIVSQKYINIFWFFPALFSIYLAIPLFASISKEKRLKIFRYLVIVGVVVNTFIPFIINIIKYFFNISIIWPFNLSVVAGYLIFPVLGYLLHQHNFTKRERIVVYEFALLGFLLHFIGTFILSRQDNSIVSLFKGYTNIPALLYASGIFVFFKTAANSKFLQKIKKPLLALQKYSFAFYLTHFFVMFYIARLLERFSIDSESLIYIPISFLGTIIGCTLITFLIRKIPKIGKIILP
ncbi:MAG: acyltransferase [Candidatus Saccharibacteria bacterium]|nr:acyltransferase [Candidatus Saccharibacteria bacterium]